ncbi:inositol 2-dehydrogenase [Cypionkella aquatica]|uniref:Inositol 2-dehydrogenase n=1 Tax=Cypionkella aquatica TaxID=1756042 RepID=A0AA37TQI0_9RHOB|nr:Gfo/Idh/MocA family oxidoreductase [Cypionkella aquatica]GLS85837.1 inositol 2-dehydrogenase [Cypionkella aquatica]
MIGIIGSGVMGMSHVATLTGLGGAKVVAVSDPDAVRVAQAAALAGGAKVLSPEALIADPSVDAVIVVSPDAKHAEQVLACLAAGKPVLCEKPLATSLADGAAILRADAGRGLVQVGYMRRFDPDYVDLKQHLQAGGAGDPLLIRMIHRNATAPAFMVGTQGITNSMVHEFDILRWLIGEEILRIRVQTPRAAKQGGLIDPLLAVAETASGILVEMENSGNVRYGYDIRTEILGSAGALMMAARPATRRQTAAGEVISHPADFTQRFADAYRIQFQDWIAALAAGKTKGAGSNAWDGYVAMAVAEAGVAALQSGDWADVSLPTQF